MILDVICSFCEISFLQSNHVVHKGGYAVCRECVAIIKEVFDEFSRAETYESGGICSFCNNPHSISNKVFQGKKVNICNLCFNIIEDELVEASIKKKKSKKPKEAVQKILFNLVRPEIRELKPYSVPDIKCRIKLDGNESPFLLSDKIKNKMRENFDNVEINRYPDSQALNLRKLISGHTGVNTDRIVLGNGSDELIEMIIRAFAGGTGKVLIPTPTFSMYKISTVTLGYEPVEVELDQDFDIDIKSFSDRIESENPDIIFLASPNNPTGNNYSKHKILSILEEVNGSGIVVLDEAYNDFSGISYLNYLKSFKNLIVLRTLSKIWFAAVRLGILFASNEICETINKVRLPYNINSYTQSFARTVFENTEFISGNVKKIINERDRVFKRLQIFPGVEVFTSHANFILLRVNNAERIFRQLLEKGILVRIFGSPDRLKNCLRVTIGTRKENESFLKALSEILSS